jgi:CheY-like chemotaxis protein
MILFLDDEIAITDIFSKLMEKKYGFEVDAYNSPNAALSAVESSPGLYDVIIADFQMPEMNGLKFSQKIREKDKIAKILICTGNPALISDEAAFETNLFSVLKKPLQTAEMAEQIQAARAEV